MADATKPPAGGSAPTRRERRKAETRAALIRAAQQLIAEERTAVPVLEITQLADVGMGSFYNHFSSKDELFGAAVDHALELQGTVLDEWTADLDDPAEMFTRSFRVTGRLHRLEPQISRVLLSRGGELITADAGLAPRALRDIRLATEAGRFKVADPFAALIIAGGATVALGHAVLADPTIDDAALTDQVAEDLLRTFGITPAQARRLANSELPAVEDVLERIVQHAST